MEPVLPPARAPAAVPVGSATEVEDHSEAEMAGGSELSDRLRCTGGEHCRSLK